MEPQTLLLSSPDRQIKESYQYVPIAESLKVLMEDETFLRQRMNDPYHHDPNVIQDVRDGDCFRTNQFFMDNPEAVPLILFSEIPLMGWYPAMPVPQVCRDTVLMHGLAGNQKL